MRHFSSSIGVLLCARRLFGPFLALAALCLAAAGATAQERVTARIPASVAGDVDVILEADRLEITRGGQRVRATGNVVVTRAEDLLHAGEALYEVAAGQIAATGGVRLTRPQGMMQAEELSYNVHSGAASGHLLRTQIPSPEPGVSFYVDGESFAGIDPEYRLRGAHFTTCDDEHEHYAVRAREIILRPGDRVVARGVSLMLLGNRVLTLPALAFNLDETRRTAQFMPRLVMGKTDLVGLRSGFSLRLPRQGEAEGYAVLSARHTIRAGAGINRFGKVPVGIRAGFKEDATSRFVSGLTVTVLPALTFYLPSEWGEAGPLQIGLPVAPEPGQMLKGHVEGGRWDTERRFRLLAAGSAGHFSEHPSEVTTNRLNLAAALEVRPFQATPRLQIDGAVRARAAWYSNGEQYSVFSPEVGLRWRPSRDDTLRLAARSHIDSGSTPFFFDRVDAPRTVALGWRNRSPSRALGAELEFDLDDGSLYAWEVSYSRRLHCLQPGLSLRQCGSDFSVGVTFTVPGLLAEEE